MACLEPCNTASCDTTPLPCLPFHHRNASALPLGIFSQPSRSRLSFWETRCRSTPRFRARTYPSFAHIWDRPSDRPVLYRGRPSKVTRDREHIRGTRERSCTRGILPGWPIGHARTARAIATSLSPPHFSRIPYLGVKISPG